jgi:hypothetical protein
MVREVMVMIMIRMLERREIHTEGSYVRRR